jgi:hypothetical protein
MKKVLIVIGVLLIPIALLSYNLGLFKFFAPKYENVRREVFENTRSYNQAKLQELSKYRLEYLRSKDEEEKKAIASTIRHRFAGYDKRKLPYELEIFLNQINGR